MPRAPFQPDQMWLEGAYFHLTSAVQASGGLGRVREGQRVEDVALAKLDGSPMNGGPELGQWWGRDVAPTLLGAGGQPWVSWENSSQRAGRMCTC